ncbi:MAG: hypothetical protein QG613_1224 [Pseudomonadota bacterium]|nr:hypothetical protein [Pseudomonadota bacterium]
MNLLREVMRVSERSQRTCNLKYYEYRTVIIGNCPGEGALLNDPIITVCIQQTQCDDLMLLIKIRWVSAHLP